MKKGSDNSMGNSSPLVSVIIPFFNAKQTLHRTVASILTSNYPNFEMITIDDRSEDQCGELVLGHPGIHLSMVARSGAAIARNLGVEASSGDILFFVDADVTISPDTISEVVNTFEKNAGLGACFGEYTPLPFGDNFPTVYKNLVHHFTHQSASEHARTFWCGCGAVKREPFLRVGGFDESFIAASVEDIDLGYRLSANGERIFLNKKLQVTHGKQYTFTSLVRSDLFNRAIPWTRLMAERNIFTADLNLKWHNVASGLMMFLLPPLWVAAGISFGWHRVWYLPLLFLFFYLFLNRRILFFVIKQKGFLFFSPFIAMYTLTYAYSSIGFAVGVVWHFASRIKRKGP